MNKSVTNAAQSVQKSGFPEAYAKWQQMAEELATAMLSGNTFSDASNSFNNATNSFNKASDSSEKSNETIDKMTEKLSPAQLRKMTNPKYKP